jgi:opacity protein-like surface antigen
MNVLRFVAVILAGCGLAVAVAPARAQSSAGFYGGIALGDRSGASSGIAFGQAAFGPVIVPVEETASQQLVFGGYRWRNELAVEAAFARSESYALRPFGAPGGVGLLLASPQDARARAAWNVDVVGSYTLRRSVALYGRVGYAQADVPPAALANLLTGDLRRPREGVNYGVGMRYDVTRTLGVNLEYSRFGRFAYESFGSTTPESDQVKLGVQFRF